MISESDRELLEMAAKAGGIDKKLIEQYNYIEGYDVNGEPIVWAGWNPLARDEDAFRLAVKLNITVCPNETIGRIKRNCASASSIDHQFMGGTHIDEPHGKDPYAATRRAIVRAAAEIWRNIP